ncbi:MAG TPA: hypothetical protein VK589_25140 [Chryseolinea sp.]|nr:hypothetical protein [Chryseolinea sp.]
MEARVYRQSAYTPAKDLINVNSELVYWHCLIFRQILRVSFHQSLFGLQNPFHVRSYMMVKQALWKTVRKETSASYYREGY